MSPRDFKGRRAAFKGLLADPLIIPSTVIEREVFAGSASIRPMHGLPRG